MAANGATLRGIAAVLFAAVAAAVFLVADPADATAVLFILPVSLLAISDGRRGGVTGAVIATLLVLLWVGVDDVELTTLGWATRMTSFFATGLLVGHYAELAGRLERGRIEERYATELHDGVLQQLVVALYSLPEDHAARPQVEAALAGVKGITSDRVAGADPGDLRLIGEPPPAASGGADAP